MKERDYGTYVEDIIEHMTYAEDFIKNLTFEEFAKDKKTILSVQNALKSWERPRNTFLMQFEINILKFRGGIWLELEIVWSMATSK